MVFPWIFIKTISELVQAGGPILLQAKVFIRRQPTTLNSDVACVWRRVGFSKSEVKLFLSH